MNILARIAHGEKLKDAIQNASKDIPEAVQDAENSESNWEYLPGKSSYKNKVTNTIITDEEYERKFGFGQSKIDHVGE